MDRLFLLLLFFFLKIERMRDEPHGHERIAEKARGPDANSPWDHLRRACEGALRAAVPNQPVPRVTPPRSPSAGTGRGGRQRRNGAAWSATPTWRCDRLVRSVAAGQAPPARNRPVDRARLDHFSRLPRPNHFQSPFRSSPVALRAYAYAPIGGTWLGASRLWSYHAFMPVIRPHLARCFDQDD